MAEDNSDQSEDDFINICMVPDDIAAKVVNGLMTADLSNYDVIPEFPNFANNLQVIRMATAGLKDIPGESSKIPNSFCQMRCLKELFLYGDYDLPDIGLSNLPTDFGNLKTLEVLNLEHNIFGEFPEQLFELENLKKLYLNACGLTSIPSKIIKIYNLLELDLSDNNFSSGLCNELFCLPKLRDLYLMNCSLSELPDVTGNLLGLEGLRVNDNFLTKFPMSLYTMKHLRKLSASNNKISKLSTNIVGLQSLEHLVLANNELTSLPSTISKLPFLKHLNVFGNKLTCLPDSVVDLDSSLKIVIHGNYFLHKPPLSICTEGIDSIKGFFTSLAKTDTIHSNRIKIVMLGESEAGKTHLSHALVNCKACETDFNDSTVGVEMHHCIIEDGLEACIVDCAGQRRYQLTHPFFLSEEALHFVVVNLTTYRMTQESFEKYVEDWINWVTARLRKPRIMIVATHKDELNEDEVEKKCQDILTRIKKHEETEIKKLDREIKVASKKSFQSYQVCREGAKSKIENLLWLRNNRPFLSTKLLTKGSSFKTEKSTCLNLVAVSSIEQLDGLITLRKEICRAVRCRCETACSKEDPLFPLVGIDLPKQWVCLEEAVRQYRREIKPSQVPCMTKEQFDQFAYKTAGLEGLEVLSALHYLDSVGELKFYEKIPETEYSVFLDLPWLCMLVKLLFRHDYDEQPIAFVDDFYEFDMEKVKFEHHLEQLKQHGRLSVPLLRCIWRELNLNDVEFFKMIRSLMTFGLACEIPGKKDELFIPWFLHTELHPQTRQDLFPCLPPSDSTELQLKFCFVGYLPSCLFDRLCVQCYSLGIDVNTWKNSMLIYRGDIEIYLEVVQSEITVTGRTKSELLEKLWNAIWEIVKELRNLLSEWPRIVYYMYTVCPHCIKNQSSNPYHFEYKSWDGQSTSMRCKRSMKKHMVEVKLLFPPKELSVPLPASVPDELLRELSSKMPLHWQRLSTFLGVSSHKIEAIKQDRIGDVTEQAYSMFSSWKQTKASQATPKALIDALKRSEREDLITNVLEYFRK